MGAEQVLPRPLDFAQVRPPAAVAQRYRTDGIGRGTTLDGDLRALTAAQPDRPAFLTDRDGRTVALSVAALLHLEQDHRRLLSVLHWLQTQTTQQDAETCKWHLSPTYAQGEMARVMSRIDHPLAHSLCANASTRIIHTQNSDGGWGTGGSTTEETAYAAVGLAAAAEQGLTTTSWESSLQQAHTFLSNHQPQLTPLWLGKTLYCVQPLVHLLHDTAIRRTETMWRRNQ
ncbi:hypothetical protein ACIQVR_05155 [Streptomyces xanthochromogenes]|uniref:hypothetical protein n=1 Tax=Streptomyces xanthochromogenes TaxID=67384 RepID=UPI0037F3D8B8